MIYNHMYFQSDSPSYLLVLAECATICSTQDLQQPLQGVRSTNSSMQKVNGGNQYAKEYVDYRRDLGSWLHSQIALVN